MSRIGSVCVALAIAACSAHAQPVTRLEQIPAVERSAADFYGAIVGAGPRVQIEWKLDPASVERTGHVVLTLVVSNAANPDELQRPPLAGMTEFKSLFDSIENLPDERKEKSAEFRYRMRPRNEGEFKLPLPKYRYYVPQLPEGRRFQLATTAGVKLTVTKPVVAKPTAVPIVAPEEFFVLPAWWHEEPAGSPGTWRPYRMAALMFPLLISLLGIVVYRRYFPDAAKRAEWLRRREVRAALQKLDAAKDSESIGRALNEYLQARWNINTSRLTAGERVEAFRRIHSNGLASDELARLLHDCERSRFGSSTITNPNATAKAWVLAVEADAT